MESDQIAPVLTVPAISTYSSSPVKTNALLKVRVKQWYALKKKIRVHDKANLGQQFFQEAKAGKKVSGGRWTREEHKKYLQGLLLY